MHFLRVLYYQSYLFYKKGWTSITKYDDISLTTFYSVSSMLGVPLGSIGLSISIVLGLPKLYVIGIALTLVFVTQIVLWMLLYRREKWKLIVKEQPVLFGNRRLSAVLTVACFVGSLLIILGFPILGRLMYVS